MVVIAHGVGAQKVEHLDRFRAGKDVATALAVDRGLRRAQRRHNHSAAVRRGEEVPFHFGIIVCALRFFTPAMSAYYRQLFQVLPHAPAEQVFATASIELARAAVQLVRDEGLPVVGFDLAVLDRNAPVRSVIASDRAQGGDVYAAVAQFRYREDAFGGG